MADEKNKTVDQSKLFSDYKGYFSAIYVPVLAVVLGLIIGAFVMMVIGKDPFRAYSVLFSSSLGSPRAILNTLMKSTPLIFTGLAVAFAFRCGLFNIGGDGQFLIAYIVTAYIGYRVGLPGFLHIPLALVVGATAGGLWGGLAGYLKAKFGVHEVISTIMLNYIALHLNTYIIIQLSGGRAAKTPVIAESAKLWRPFAISRFNTSFLIAIIASLSIYFILWKTTTGYEVRAVGLNPSGAEYGGINISRKTILTMFISGALAGLAGSTQVLGLEFKALQLSAFTGLGFTGIAVALVGKNHPIGVILSAFLFGILAQGANQMQNLANVPKEVVEIIQAIIIFFVAIEYLFKIIQKRMNEEKEREIADARN
ncbi:MAG: ABC transporter permease [Halanaerobiales bacterium]